jgi:hypothetical protein
MASRARIHELHVRCVEPADGSLEFAVERGVRVRRIRESDVEDRGREGVRTAAPSMTMRVQREQSADDGDATTPTGTSTNGGLTVHGGEQAEFRKFETWLPQSDALQLRSVGEAGDEGDEPRPERSRGRTTTRSGSFTSTRSRGSAGDDHCNNPNEWAAGLLGNGRERVFREEMMVSNGVYVVTDRLGSVRANTQGESFAYYPYGEERTNTVNGRDKFATYFRDAVGQDYADQRYYNSGTGRFWTVDPGGIAAAGPAKSDADLGGIKSADPTRPGTWNRYAYTSGDPINFGDPSGRYEVYEGSGPCIIGVGEGAELTTCDEYTEGLLGPDDPVEVPTSGAKTIPHSQVPGFGLAMDALENPECAGAVQKGGTVASAQTGLNAEAYIAWYPGVPSAIGASTVAQTSGFTVMLNTTIFDDPENATVASTTAAGVTYGTGNLVQWMVSYYGLDASAVTTTDFQAIILLHELGHSLGGLPSDASSPGQSLVNTGTIIDDCFGSLLKH